MFTHNNTMRVLILVLFLIFHFSTVLAQIPEITQYSDTIIDGKKVEIRKKTNQNWSLLINEIMALNSKSLSDENKEFDDWIEIFNFGETPVNLNGLYISDDLNFPRKWQITSDIVLQPRAYYLFWADNQPEQGNGHLNFKLEAEGENLAIYTNDLILIDQVHFPQQFNDISYGRINNSSEIWSFFQKTTPLTLNSLQYSFDILPAPIFSKQGGFFTEEFFLSMSSPSGANIFYTLDGSKPSSSSLKYSNPIEINKTTLFRACCISDGHLNSVIKTHTYFFDVNLNLPIVSAVSDEKNFWGISGILTNIYSGIETEAHLEYFDKNKNLAFSINGGLTIHSPDGRNQKAFRFYTRSRYDSEEINYKIFSQKNLAKFERLVFRSAGNDMLQSGFTHLRDPLIHVLNGSLEKPADYSAYQPVNLFLNGQYWGIYNLREHEDLEYIENTFGEQNNLDFLEHVFGYTGLRYAIEGNWAAYNAMNEALKTTDLSNTENYNFFKDSVDIEEYITYLNVEIFSGNADWIANNVKFWKDKPTGKWRWVLWDLDHAFGLPFEYNGVNFASPNWNTLANLLSMNGFRTGDNGFYNVYIRSFIKNEEFKQQFINRGADLLNTVFAPENTLRVLDSLKSQIEPDVQAHCQKWGSSLAEWEKKTQTIKDYLQVRQANVFEHFKTVFDIQKASIVVKIFPENAGKIRINTIKVPNNWTGSYFAEIPIEIEAIPNRGFEFANWGEISKKTAKIKILPSEGLEIVAYFNSKEEIINPVINEINYNSHSDYNSGDWFELYNPSNQVINLSNWKLKDSNEENVFFFPNINLQPESFFVFCSDVVKYKAEYPHSSKYYGNIGFKFSSEKETLLLYNPVNELVDSVSYISVYPWYSAANGQAYTLSLLNPTFDNALPQNWGISDNKGGTPESKNFDILLNFESEENSFEVKIYPNPITDFLQIELPKNEKVEVFLFNIYGKMIVFKEIYSNTFIEMQNLASGIYILKVKNSRQIYTQKILKI